MKKIIIGLCIIIVVQALCIVYMNNAISQNTKCIKALEQYTKAQIYKKDAQLYLMNSQWGNPEVHRSLADSCKMDCINYKSSK